MGFGDGVKTTQPSPSPTMGNVKRGFVTLVYGGPASGKTFFALSFPEPICFIDTENRADITRSVLFGDKDVRIHEPLELKMDVNKSMDDVFDEVTSINNLSNVLSNYVSDINSGKITGGTLVIDSVTDVWKWIQSWGFEKLGKMKTAGGKSKADEDMQTVTDQRDWKLMNNKHEGMILVLRALTRRGFNVVFTARERTVPDYVTDKPQNEERIKSQKELPYASDVILNLRKNNGRYLAYCDKLGVQKIPSTPLENMSYQKLMELKPMG